VPVVTFPVAGRGNCAVVDGTPYVYATVRGSGFVMRARCPHRGGPLHLAAAPEPAGTGGRPGAARLVCPWHERKTSVAMLRAEIPAVRTGTTVTAVFPDRPRTGAADRAAQDGAAPDGTAQNGAAQPRVVLEHRPLSADLARCPG
jgi:nitrite reductase (NADH) small subunit